MTTYTETVIEQTPERIRIVMPTQKAGCVAAFMSVWLVGWLAGETFALVGLVRELRSLSVGSIFLVVWLIGWTLGGAFAITVLAMSLGGREIVTFSASEARRRVEAFRIGLDWRYPMADVTNVRPTASSGDKKEFISFDHKGKTIRFGTGLSEENATAAVEAVWERFPALMPRVERVRREEAAADSAAPTVAQP
ncbi:MAG: hypothetical protein HGB10_06710 [Coriobacteriia bacterium]|nr:hypothetical protein [Coriobacteriia bacterium]